MNSSFGPGIRTLISGGCPGFAFYAERDAARWQAQSAGRGRLARFEECVD
jgi:hypothetical protein